ncbi:MAG TPA: ATP synthase F1 subunit gamma [Terriglobales bacterium]|nr:ATP synthase F1 subunit gamma [Terriglobales bacterium]
MPNLLDIRRRLRSVRNMRQITKAMQMVSAAKLRRAQEQALAARPYAERLAALLADVAARLDAAEVAGADGGADLAARLLAAREERRIAVLVVSADSGLAGAFNANVVKAAVQFALERPGREFTWEAIGRKARDYYRRRGLALSGEHVGLFARRTIHYEIARGIAAEQVRRYAAAEVDAVYTIGNEFKSVLQQRIAVRRLLPVAPPAAAADRAAGDAIFEPPPAQLLATLLPRYVEVQVYRALLESFAAEHAARMNAMDTATKNAGDLIDSLTLNLNRVRQAAITKEIIEVVSGAAAQSG